MVAKGYSSPEYQSVYKSEKAHRHFTYRKILGTELLDRTSIYPFYPREIDLSEVFDGNGCITTTVISDPLNNNAEWFRGNYIENYKQHAVVCLPNWSSTIYPENHKRNIKKGQKEEDFLVSEVVTFDPKNLVGDFKRVYNILIERHNIAQDAWTHYSEDQIEQLLNVPGAVLFRTSFHEDDEDNGKTAGYSLFFIDGDNVYYHIGCQTELGYKNNSNFIMMDTAIRFFQRLGLKYLEIGASPDGGGGGLKRFKEGFANETRTNRIIKVIHDQDKYNELCKDKSGDFFPLYRS